MSDICKPFMEPGFKNCRQYSGKSKNIPTAKEKSEKSEYRISNPGRKHIIKLLVDDCLIKGDENKKCDYLYLNCEDRIVYFIELKGGDLVHSIKQIESSIQLLSSILTNFKIMARIVLTRTPPARVTNQQKEKIIKALRKWQNNENVPVSMLFKMRTVRLEESI